MKEPLISVIVPTYNGEQWITQAIESILDQTYPNFEILVVDDGSKDGTVKKLEPYKSRITLLQKENGATPAGARNYALPYAKGEILAFLDHDDLWQKNKLETSAQVAMDNPDALFLFSDFNRRLMQDGKFYALSNSQIYPFIYEALRNQYFKNYKSFIIPGNKMFEIVMCGYPLYPSTMLMRRALFDKIGPWNADPHIRGNEDFDISIRSTQVTDFIYIDERLVTIQRHDKNLSEDYFKQIKGDLRVIDLFLTDNRFPPEVKNKMNYYKGKRLCGLGYSYLSKGRKSEGRQSYIEAMSNPSWTFHAFVRIILSMFS